ncbi:MAG: hypothetical protein KGL63_13735 [Betaproteobacteria bacterium]|nr:hypothetical protein [Betaproteobacteria bacterium]
MTIITGHPDEMKMRNMQKEAAVAVLNLTLKADEQRFRVHSERGIIAILDEVRRLRSAELIESEPIEPEAVLVTYDRPQHLQ